MEKNRFNWYQENGFPQTVIEAAQKICSTVESYYDLSFDTVFISNKINDGQMDYTSVWLFNDTYVAECKGFLARFNIDIVRYKDYVEYFNLIANNEMAFESPTDDSRMKVDILLKNTIRCSLDAAGRNCSQLKAIAKKYLEDCKK